MAKREDVLRKSYYSMLGVAPNESAAGIRQAFREVVKRYHPDRVGLERAGFFRQIVEAYHVLADPERRRNYDDGLYHADTRSARAPGAVPLGASAPAELPRAVSVLRTLYIKDAPFEAALARVSGSLTAAEVISKQYCDALNATVILSAAEAEQGGIIFLTVPSASPCERCRGSGQQGMFPCEQCDGEGILEEEEQVRAHVRPGTGDGTVIAVPLRGLGVHNFYLRLHVRVVF
jgi:molecular chaperone DnaJ